MPDARRPEYASGNYYHIYNRGRSRLPISREDENYRFVLTKLKRYSREFDVCVVAYCLMPNHYHWLVRQDGDKPAGLLVQRVFNSYTKAYNERYGHSGTLFEGNYRAKHVDSDRYLRHLCCYVHSNPVKDGLVTHLEQWPYSNYLEWIGKRSGTLVDRAFVADMFPDVEQYRASVVEFIRSLTMPGDLSYLSTYL